ncbi:MAG: helicase-associated domain-containing protein [Deltaproteobacteria bacterium]|nr:helicase-associated domain-containing protein [Deltaproteobacteria bacterium]
MARTTSLESSHPSLQAALEEAYGADTLKAFAGLVGLRGVTRKAEVARALAEALLGHDLRGPRLEELWARLDDLQRAAVSEALHGAGCTFQGERFRAKYGAMPSWGALSAWKPEPTLLGLLLISGVPPRVPPDLAERLRTFVPKPRGEQLTTLDEPFSKAAEELGEPLRLHDAERTIRQELFAVLRLVDRGKVQVSDKTKKPSTKGVAEIGATLAGGDFYGPDDEPESRWAGTVGPIRAFAWPLLLQVGGLAKLSGTRLELTAAGRKALTLPAHETLRLLWKKWVGTTAFDEFNRVEVVKGQSTRKCLTAVAGRRAIIHRALGTCPAGCWIAVDELFRYMRSTGNTFALAHTPWKLYICEQRYGSFEYGGSQDWQILEGRYVLAVLFEYAATLGLVDLAYTSPSRARKDFRGLWGVDDLSFLSRYDGLACLRVNALGAYILGSAETYEPTAPAPRSSLKVLPNLDVVASSGRFDPGDEALLAVFCVRRSEAVFGLDRAAALAAVEKGHRADELRSFLAQASSTGLPDTARAFLDDLAHRAGTLRLTGHALLVECADETLARRIAHDARTKALCTLAGKKTLVVPAENETAFRRAALEFGYPLLAAEGDSGKLP